MNPRPASLSDLHKFGVRFEGEGTSQTGTTGQPNPAPTQIPQSGTRPKNNDENNVDDFSGLWDNEPIDNQQPQQTPQQSGGGPAPEPNDAQSNLDRHIQSINFLDGVELDTLRQNIATGSSEGLDTALTQTAANAYKRALVDMNSIVEQRVENAVRDAVSRSQQNMGAEFNVRRLESALPFAADKALQPVARAVFAQLLKKKDGDVDSAIEGVRSFFKRTRQISAKDVGDKGSPPRARPGSIPRRENLINDNDDDFGDDDEIDWDQIVSGTADQR